MISPDTALVGLRLAADASALFLWGSSAYLSCLVPAGLRAILCGRLRMWWIAAAVVTTLAALAGLPAHSAHLGSGWGDAAVPAVLRAVATQTSAGTAWCVQAAGAVLCLAGILAPRRLRLPLIMLASLCLLWSFTFTGHAAMHSGALGLFHRANDFLHLVAGGAWMGSLLPVWLILRHLGEKETGTDARVALARFSLAGHAAVALVLLSGVINTGLILGSLPTDWAVPYQALLCAKIGIVLGMVGLALFNRYYLVPRLARSLAASRALAAGTLAEIIAAIVVVGLVAWFGMLDPFPV